MEKEKAEHILRKLWGIFGDEYTRGGGGLRGHIEDRLVEKIKKIVAGPEEDWRNEGNTLRNQKSIKVTVMNKFFIKLELFTIK